MILGIQTKKDFLTSDTNVVFSHFAVSDDDMSRPTTLRVLETFLFQDAIMSDKVVIVAETRHTRPWFERGVELLWCTGDRAFFCKCPITTDLLRLWAQERTPGVLRDADNLQSVEIADISGAIAEDRHLTQCAQMCFVGTEEDQSEPHDQGTIDDILEDQYTGKFPCATAAADEAS